MLIDVLSKVSRSLVPALMAAYLSRVTSFNVILLCKIVYEPTVSQ